MGLRRDRHSGTVVHVGEFGLGAAYVLGTLLASWGVGSRRGRAGTPPSVVRLDHDVPGPRPEPLLLTTQREGSSAVITVVGAMDREHSAALATHVAELVRAGSEWVVVDAEGARSASRVVEALSVASPALAGRAARLALVPPKGEMLSASVQLTANGLGDRITVYDSVGEATRAVGHTHTRS